jgi:hypothetical protein
MSLSSIPETYNSNPIGLSHWEQRRAQWTRGHKPYDPETSASESYQSNPALKEVEPCHFDAIYQSLVDGRRFAKPVPLSFITTILVSDDVLG